MTTNNTQIQQPPQASNQRRWVEVLSHLWPTALGLAVAALTVFDLEVNADSVSSLSALIFVMALVYLGAAALDRPWSAWVILLGGLVVMVGLDILDLGVDPVVGLLGVALGLLVFGVVRRQLRKPGGLTLQTIGMLVFGGITLIALYVEPSTGAYLVVAALFAHAAWDALHFWWNSVVPRSYAEFCFVLDFVLGAAILFLI